MSLPSSSARRKLSSIRQVQSGFVVLESVTSTGNPDQLTFQFSQPIILRGKPNVTLNNDGQTVTAASQTDVDKILLTFTDAVAGAVTVSLLPYDPAIVGKAGQLFIPSLDFPL